MNLILCCDFGSTFTKLCVIDPHAGEIVASAKAFTTAQSNIMDGYNTALYEIHKICGRRDFETRLAASSAAGGLKMVACGLVPDLTAKAARLAAASAGAKVLKTYAYELTPEDTAEIESIAPDIILLCGGIDGGNKDVLLKNAESLAHTAGNFCIIIAGNRSAATQAEKLANESGKKTVVCENVMPQFGKLNIEPAKNAIQELFIHNIISAKGLDEAQGIMSDTIIPTPLAVYEAAKLLSHGTETTPGLGELMILDIGGATTDVYSMASGLPASTNVYVQGLIEPFAKRTVEGDIGMRYSLAPMLSAIAENSMSLFLSTHGISEAELDAWLAICTANPDALPTGVYSAYAKIETALAHEAIRISAARHAGSYERVYTPVGETIVQTGKDLSGVKYVIGTGGAIINAADPRAILQAATYTPQDTNILKPQSPALLLDKEYCLAAMGLLSRKFPEIALEMMKQKMKV